MKGAALLAVVSMSFAATGVPSLRAGAAQPAMPAAPDLRAIMRAEYHFIPPAATPVDAGRAEAKPVPAGVIQLPTVIVQEKRSHDAELTATFAGQVAAAKQQVIMDKLGIGVKGVTVGKHFEAGAVTVFHLPVCLFAGFSW